jgi:hypothetical protein
MKRIREASLACLRKLAQSMGTLFHGFTIDDVCALLSANGFYEFEVSRLRGNQSETQTEKTEELPPGNRELEQLPVEGNVRSIRTKRWLNRLAGRISRSHFGRRRDRKPQYRKSYQQSANGNRFYQKRIANRRPRQLGSEPGF